MFDFEQNMFTNAQVMSYVKIKGKQSLTSRSSKGQGHMTIVQRKVLIKETLCLSTSLCLNEFCSHITK